MNSKSWLVTYIILSLLLIGGAGYFCYHFSNQYKRSKISWNKGGDELTKLRKKELYPSKENVEKVKQMVDGYETSVKQLFDSLDEFQRPLVTELKGSEFSIKMAQSATDFRQYCRGKGFEIQDVENFRLGFEEYSIRTPKKEVVAELEYGLNAAEHLLRNLVEAGGRKLEFIARDKIAGEEGGPAPDLENSVVKYPIRLAFEAKHEAFRTFLNGLPNDKKFFYIVRLIEVKNTIQEGPYKNNSSSLNADLRFDNAVTGKPATPEQLLKWGLGTSLPEDIEVAAEDDGYIRSGDDARQIMGDELINVFMVVDVVRFVDTKVQANAESVKKKSSSTKKKTTKR